MKGKPHIHPLPFSPGPDPEAARATASLTGGWEESFPGGVPVGVARAAVRRAYLDGKAEGRKGAFPDIPGMPGVESPEDLGRVADFLEEQARTLRAAAESLRDTTKTDY